MYISGYIIEVESKESQRQLEKGISDLFFNKLKDRRDIVITGQFSGDDPLDDDNNLHEIIVKQVSKATYDECKSLFWENYNKSIMLDKDGIERKRLKTENDLLLDRIQELKRG